MKKTVIIILCIIALTVISVGSFALYKSTLSGIAQANCAEVIVDLQSSEGDEFTINSDNLTLSYDFTVNNYITEGSEIKRNEILIDYYIRVFGLTSSIFNVHLYYIDDSENLIELNIENIGNFIGYYKATETLPIDVNVSHNYRLQASVDETNLQNLIKAVSIDIRI